MSACSVLGQKNGRDQRADGSAGADRTREVGTEALYEEKVLGGSFFDGLPLFRPARTRRVRAYHSTATATSRKCPLQTALSGQGSRGPVCERRGVG
jgi:hypothetical protein